MQRRIAVAAPTPAAHRRETLRARRAARHLLPERGTNLRQPCVNLLVYSMPGYRHGVAQREEKVMDLTLRVPGGVASPLQ